jgi:hypothetical protein
VWTAVAAVDGGPFELRRGPPKQMAMQCAVQRRRTLCCERNSGRAVSVNGLSAAVIAGMNGDRPIKIRCCIHLNFPSLRVCLTACRTADSCDRSVSLQPNLTLVPVCHSRGNGNPGVFDPTILKFLSACLFTKPFAASGRCTRPGRPLLIHVNLLHRPVIVFAIEHQTHSMSRIIF